MSGISKGRIIKRRDALKAELQKLLTTVAQYQAAIAEHEELLKPEEDAAQPAAEEYIEATAAREMSQRRAL